MNLALFCNGCFRSDAAESEDICQRISTEAVTSVEATSHFTSSIEA